MPAVISGAAGIYAITLLADADNAVDVTVHPGQVVHIRAGVARALRCGAGGEGRAALASEMKEKNPCLEEGMTSRSSHSSGDLQAPGAICITSTAG